jgi:K+-sensing histidine kinase KdpD
MLEEYDDGEEGTGMALALTRRDRWALLFAVVGPAAVAWALSVFRDEVSAANAVLVLVVVVVAVAAQGSRLAGVLAALSAGVWFEFFFTQPYSSFAIADQDDVETFVLLLVVGVAVTELALWGRRHHATAVRDAGYLEGLRTAADLTAIGSSQSQQVRNAERQLTQVLHLRSCRFQPGVAGLGQPARLLRDGRVAHGVIMWDAERGDLPGDVDIELLVESGGTVLGRFLMQPVPGAPVAGSDREQAVAIADQLGAALR